MSINDKIEAAWKAYKPEALSTNSMALSHEVFAAGYRAALKRLFLDSDFSECRDGDWFWVLTDRGWNESMKIGDGFEVITVTGDCEFTCCREDVKRIVYVSLPSPSEVFGEEGV